eukprot:SAG31_NODE_9350_length_1291_cov_1.290268_2_plen_315_part_01
MASQHYIAFSDRISGLGHIDAAPYGCSKLQSSLCKYNCACTGGAAAQQMLTYAAEAAAAGHIADLSNVKNDKVWVMSGGADTIVNHTVGATAADLYSRMGASVAFHIVPDAEHAFVTDTNNSGVANSCGYLGAPFINDCGYDMAGAIFTHLLGPLKPRAPFVLGHVRRLQQSAYFPQSAEGKRYTPAQMAMSDFAYAYVPGRCGNNSAGMTRESRQSCQVHVMYHGCDSSADIVWPIPVRSIGMSIVEHAGFNEHAEANDIVVLYPQAHMTDCWDWDGEFPAPLTQGYDTRKSTQIGVVNRMVDDIMKWLQDGDQ